MSCIHIDRTLILIGHFCIVYESYFCIYNLSYIVVQAYICWHLTSGIKMCLSKGNRLSRMGVQSLKKELTWIGISSGIRGSILLRVWDHIWSLVQICYGLSMIIMIQLGHTFAHIKTVQLSWYVQNCGLIGSSFLFKVTWLFTVFVLWTIHPFYNRCQILYHTCWLCCQRQTLSMVNWKPHTTSGWFQYWCHAGFMR